MTLQTPASLVQPFDESLFNNPIDGRIVEKLVYRSVAFVFPIQHGLNHGRIYLGVTIEILDGIFIGLVERIVSRPACIFLTLYRQTLFWFSAPPRLRYRL